MNHLLTAPQRAIGLQTEIGKGTGEPSTPAAKSYFGAGISEPAAKFHHRGARFTILATKICRWDNSISTSPTKTCRMGGDRRVARN